MRIVVVLVNGLPWVDVGEMIRLLVEEEGYDDAGEVVDDMNCALVE